MAQAVWVMGDFNDWNQTQDLLQRDDSGFWTTSIPGVKPDQKYKFRIKGPAWNQEILNRPDPCARQMEHSAGSSIIKDPLRFTWTDEYWEPHSFEDMVIYELHVPTFIGKNDGQGYPGNLKKLLTKLDYIKNLGANTIELLPLHEYAGDNYLGYAPVAFFPIESSYGSAEGTAYDELKEFVNAAHSKNIAVIADVVFNHFTDRDKDDKWIWNYDGDSKYEKGGIYFSGLNTSWGPAPDWERAEVIEYVKDTCSFYLSELHFDGLRWDATDHIKNKPNGWNAMRDILWNLKTFQGNEKKIFIAEQLPFDREIVHSGNFDAGWWVEFHHSLEKELGGNQTRGSSIENGINGGEYSKIYQRIIYLTGHDEARNGSQYVVSEFGGRNNWDARAKCRLMGSLQFFVPGIPMIWQGEEFLQDGCFDDNSEKAVDWHYQMDGVGSQMQKMYQDAIAVRNLHTSLKYGSLTWTHPKDANQIVAFQRHDPVNSQTSLVIVNFSGTDWVDNHGYSIHTGISHGAWEQLFCSQDAEYGGWDGAGNAYYEALSQNDGIINLNIPKFSVIVMKLK